MGPRDGQGGAGPVMVLWAYMLEPEDMYSMYDIGGS